MPVAAPRPLVCERLVAAATALLARRRGAWSRLDATGQGVAMALQVVRTGIGRTGTGSMHEALNMLGFGLCHRM